MLWRGTKGGNQERCTLSARRLGHDHRFGRSLPAVRCSNSSHYIPTLYSSSRTRNNALLTQGAPSSRGSGMGSGQSPVVNILITTSALQNCCHHSRTHHWRRGQSRQLSAGLWFNFIDELADLFLHHRRRDQPRSLLPPLLSPPLLSSPLLSHSPSLTSHARTLTLIHSPQGKSATVPHGIPAAAVLPRVGTPTHKPQSGEGETGPEPQTTAATATGGTQAAGGGISTSTRTGTHCARPVILLTACVFAQRVRRSRHSFWNHPGRRSWLVGGCQ